MLIRRRTYKRLSVSQVGFLWSLLPRRIQAPIGCRISLLHTAIYYSQCPLNNLFVQSQNQIIIFSAPAEDSVTIGHFNAESHKIVPMPYLNWSTNVDSISC